MPREDALTKIAEDVLAGRPRRAKVRTLMGYYGLKRRLQRYARSAGSSSLNTSV